ncbi:MAG: U32 family peptidase [Oscillospiraceae bacterium]|nr:U32 family peptidase [Oscillospiraceae bacterium]
MNFDNLEVLSPAGSFESLRAAVDYGADAVYLGGQSFGMRAGPENFTYDSLKSAVELSHSKGVKVYLTCNTLPRNNEIPNFRQFIEEADDCGVDAVIVADLGLLSLVKEYCPDMEVHMSTQTGIVNYVTARELYNMGVKRVVAARELSLEEISEIRAKTPAELDIEAFVHGAMCVSFSGRCLLSQYLVNRDANRGECAQPCRWSYSLMEETRKGEYYPIMEDGSGTYILNAKDLCMIEHLDKVARAGITSFKIEGRAKSSYYVSIVTNAYRMAVDILKQNPDNYKLPQWVLDEVFKVSHRAYCTGFFFGHPKDCQYYKNSGYIREYDVVAIVDECKDGVLYCTQRNKFFKGDELEIIAPGEHFDTFRAEELYNGDGEPIESANHAMMKLRIPFGKEYPPNSIIRIKR